MPKENKKSIIYVCSDCGAQNAKWFGRCPSCGAWNTMNEEVYVQPERKLGKGGRTVASVNELDENSAQPISQITGADEVRFNTGIGEFDRALGGGLVKGSVTLLSGEPGIGKSTLLLQLCGKFDKNYKILYVSGEESKNQIKMRANRLRVNSDSLYILNETNVDKIHAEIDKLSPNVVIIDSIQTVYYDSFSSSPGSVVQVREAAMSFLLKAKNTGISVMMVGHVNKEGGIAGPKVLEHMVDTVLYFEGERLKSYRIIRAIKNRYGSVSEIGVFEMRNSGLEEVSNPSELLLSGRVSGISGNCAVGVLEGTRPIIAEIQALVSSTVFPSPRRTASGVDYNRLCLLLAVLEKRLRLRFSAQDVYINVVGGLKLDDPACDLAVIIALVSSLKDLPVDVNIVAVGEVGLSGEVRQAGNLEIRINEAARLGFKKILVPAEKNLPDKIKGAEIIKVKSIFDSLDHAGLNIRTALES